MENNENIKETVSEESKLFINQNKKATIVTSAGSFYRGAIATHFVQVGESYVDLVKQYVVPEYQEGDILSISEKIISLCQKRVIYKKDMKISGLAKFLAKFASTSSTGIGVNNVYKMQFAIDHCGKLKIIWASIAAGICKLFGKKGVFYDIAGIEVRGLDGFYDSAYPVYGEFGIRLPENPDKVCEEIFQETGVVAMVVDANDFTVDILGKCSKVPYTDEELADIIRDNPSGQSTQQTPFVIIRKEA